MSGVRDAATPSPMSLQIPSMLYLKGNEPNNKNDKFFRIHRIYINMSPFLGTESQESIPGLYVLDISVRKLSKSNNPKPKNRNAKKFGR